MNKADVTKILEGKSDLSESKYRMNILLTIKSALQGESTGVDFESQCTNWFCLRLGMPLK